MFSLLLAPNSLESRVSGQLFSQGDPMQTLQHYWNPSYSRVTSMALVAFLAIVFASAPDAHAQRRKSALGDKSDATEKKKAAPQANQPGTTTTPAASKPNPNTNPNQPKKDAQKESEFAPQVVTMTVKREGIQLIATWFPPIIEKDAKKKKKANSSDTKEEDSEPGKSVAPFILVHDWTRSRNDLLQLALFLQKQGHAVIVPDLRGHGESIRAAGMTKPIDHANFNKAEQASAIGDIDQCKRFLQEKNNEGIINIDLLNVVAVGDSAHLAIAWTITDWSWDPVAGIKQGKDVKSLVLFSPTNRFAGSTLKKLAKTPLISGRNSIPLPMLVIWGGKSGSAEGCSDFVDLLRKHRPEVAENQSDATRWQTQNLFDLEAPTAMEGFQLAGNPNAAQIWNFANNFVSQKVMEFKQQFPWQIRGAEAVLKARQAEEDK